jgi:hypothetical protein
MFKFGLVFIIKVRHQKIKSSEKINQGLGNQHIRNKIVTFGSRRCSLKGEATNIKKGCVSLPVTTQS